MGDVVGIVKGHKIGCGEVENDSVRDGKRASLPCCVVASNPRSVSGRRESVEVAVVRDNMNDGEHVLLPDDGFHGFSQELAVPAKERNHNINRFDRLRAIVCAAAEHQTSVDQIRRQGSIDSNAAVICPRLHMGTHAGEPGDAAAAGGSDHAGINIGASSNATENVTSKFAWIDVSPLCVTTT